MGMGAHVDYGPFEPLITDGRHRYQQSTFERKSVAISHNQQNSRQNGREQAETAQKALLREARPYTLALKASHRISRCRTLMDALMPLFNSHLLFRAVGLIALASLFAGPAKAIESAWDATPEARARLLSAVDATGSEGELRFGIEFVLKDGWKTYWRAPGPQGYPPNLEWDGSDNIASAEIIWPTPERFTILGFDSIGYTGGVLLPVTVKLQDPAKAARFKLTVDYLTCAEVCVPQTATLALNLPAGSAKPSKHAFAIDKARGQAPAPAGAGSSLNAAWLTGPDDQPALVVEGSASTVLSKADFFVDGLPGYFFGTPTFEDLGEGQFRATAKALEAPLDAVDYAKPGAEFSVTLASANLSFEQRTALGPPRAAASSSGGPGLLLMLGIALLGGLILNVMPCVLPVLAIKLMGALEHASAGRAAVRRGFAASAAGIIVSFLVLAGLAIGLKSAGVAVGWGIQFQQPFFVGAMAMVMALFAANLWGAFEIEAPDAIGRAGAALSGTGKDGIGNSFWTGVLATALATPCSAPFVGSALSFALSRGSGEILAIFAAMGAGLALPYLLTALFPAVARILPRPGAWMNIVRRVLAIAVALTGAWLLWVLFRQAGIAATLGALAAAVLLVIALMKSDGPRRWAMAAGAFVMGGVLVTTLASAPKTDGPARFAWAPFDRAEITRRVASGEVILVDVTADWCVTCKWNKAAVLSREPVAALLETNVIPMQADWTRPDPIIANYLASFGRYGIPFNVVYGPSAPNGVPLPELLNADAVLQGIEKAR